MHPPHRSASVLIVLTVSLAVMVAGCGASSATTTPPGIAGVWTGRFIDYEDPAHPHEAGQVYLSLEQSSNSQLSGPAKLCAGGFFSIPVEINNVSGTVTGSSHVQLDVGPFHLDGTYSTQSFRHIALEGTFSSSPGVQKAIALTLLPGTDMDYELACTQTPTPSPAS